MTALPFVIAMMVNYSRIILSAIMLLFFMEREMTKRHGRYLEMKDELCEVLVVDKCKASEINVARMSSSTGTSIFR